MPNTLIEWALTVMGGSTLIVFAVALQNFFVQPMMRTFVHEPKCDTILSAGPYRVIRHPIYLSYALAWFAAPVAMRSLALGLTAVFMTTCYIMSSRREEQLLASGPRAAEYERYRAGTWRLIPFVY